MLEQLFANLLSNSGEQEDNPLGSILGGGFNPQAPMSKEQEQMDPFKPERAGGIADILGIKGGFRDALGTIGDALLTANDADPVYGPLKKRNQVNEAMHGFADNPMEGIKRVAKFDPILAQKMAQDLQEKQAQAQKDKLGLGNSSYDLKKKGLEVFGAIAGGVNEATMGPMKERLMSISQETGLGLEQAISNAKTPQELQGLAQMAITAEKRADDERLAANVASAIERREFQNQNDSTRTGIAASTAASQNNRRTFQNQNDAVRTGITASEAGSRNANRGRTGGRASQRASSSSAPVGTIPASRVPSSARLGKDASGRRVANFGGKTYYIGN